jgi:hypothetical protein
MTFNRFIAVIFVVGLSPLASADGNTIDKIYHPYVQLLEREIEYTGRYQHDKDTAIESGFRHRLGYGQSLSDTIFVEAYIIAEDSYGESSKVEAFELELKWQLTEQGEFDNDWGLLFELENEREDNIWEASTTLIALHEWEQWILTNNFSVIYEAGSAIDNEFEVAYSGQLRYRNTASFEPAIELFQSQDTSAIGPMATGLVRLGGGKKLFWEFGVLIGVNNDTPDTNWKLNLEYEFQ